MNQLRLAALVAREDLTDNLRQRRVLLTLVLAPVALIVLLGIGPALFANQSERSDANLRASLALPRDTPTAVVETLRPALRVVLSDDPERELANDNADAVLEVVGEADAHTRLHVHEVTSSRSKGFVALRVAEGRLAEWQAAASGGQPIPIANVNAFAVVDAAESRGLLAPVIPTAFVITMLGGVVQLGASRFASGRAMRTTEMLLVRPIRRSTLLAGVAGSAIVLGTLGSALVLAPLGLLALGIGNHDGPGGVWGAALGLVIAWVALMFTSAATGIVLGVGGKSLSAAQARGTLIIAGVGGFALVFQLSESVAKASIIGWLPVGSAMVLLKEIVTTGFDTGQAMRALGITVVFVALAFRYVTRRLDSEEMAARV